MENNLYIAVYTDFSVCEFVSEQAALKTEPFLVFEVSYKGSIKSHYNNQVFNHHNWNIIYSATQKKTLSIKKWNCTEIFSPIIHTYCVNYIISDPSGKVRNFHSVKTPQDSFKKVLEDIIFLIMKTSNYNNWEEYDLNEENIQLQTENEKLKQEIENLKRKIGNS